VQLAAGSNVIYSDLATPLPVANQIDSRPNSEMPKLFLLCGKIASGKSTLAGRLADRPATILVSQDRLMAKLYPDEISTIEDYAKIAPRLRDAMGGHLVSVLRGGLSIVLDWPANTVRVRSWMRSIFEAAGAGHELHILDATDPERRARLTARNATGEHEYIVDAETLEIFDRYFEEPTAAEAFNIIRHG
jgi:predicted kinase